MPRLAELQQRYEARPGPGELQPPALLGQRDVKVLSCRDGRTHIINAATPEELAAKLAELRPARITYSPTRRGEPDCFLDIALRFRDVPRLLHAVRIATQELGFALDAVSMVRESPTNLWVILATESGLPRSHAERLAGYFDPDGFDPAAEGRRQQDYLHHAQERLEQLRGMAPAHLEDHLRSKTRLATHLPAVQAFLASGADLAQAWLDCPALAQHLHQAALEATFPTPDLWATPEGAWIPLAGARNLLLQSTATLIPLRRRAPR